mmetsp:Transcript_41273/g.86188  ORF Transcript_41273/g.86188 Transcript_41273/m.86188 type:complete len:343 (-) Transcript_41273:54-1082(-)
MQSEAGTCVVQMENTETATKYTALPIPQANAIAINDIRIDPKSDVAKMLREADKDQDGSLNLAEITAVFQDLSNKQSQIRMLFYMLISQFALLLMFAAVSFALVWIVVDSRSNTVRDGVMVDRRTGAPIQVASSEIAVNDGVLVSRNASNSTSPAVQVSVLESSSQEINSHWATADLLQLKSITLSDDTLKGAFLSADVTGVVRVLDSSGAAVVLFQTALGRFVLQDSALVPAEDFEGGIFANTTAADIVNGRLGSASNRRGIFSFVRRSVRMLGRVVGRQSPLCWAQKLNKIGCFLVRQTDNSPLAEVCASGVNDFFMSIPCSPTQAAVSLVRMAYNSNRW